MITSNELELKTTLTLGTLETNAEAIQTFVKNKLAEYTPDKYVGKVEEAKADRAVLNAAEKTLNSKRLELERQYMVPFNKFKEIITDTCKAIKQASGALDSIVKEEEERERMEKWKKIESYWNETGFKLFDVSQVFNTKWLNKTAKMKDVCAEIDAIQKKTFEDLKIIEKFPPEDVPLIKTEYINTLDITQAMQKAEQLKANRERLATEKKEREAMERRAQLEQQQKQELEENREIQTEEKAGSLADQALGLTIKEEVPEYVETYALVLQGTKEQLLKVRQAMTDAGVTYAKLVDKGNGVYTI